MNVPKSWNGSRLQVRPLKTKENGIKVQILTGCNKCDIFYMPMIPTITNDCMSIRASSIYK